MAGTWASGGNLAAAKTALGGAGLLTAGLSFGGYNGGALVTTEEYDGTSWSSGGNLPAGRYYLSGSGLQTAALAVGGYTTVTVATTTEYDGTSWAAGGNLGTARDYLTGCGVVTAGLVFGGTLTPINTTEEYDGTSWAAGNNLGTARHTMGGCGTQIAGLCVAGKANVRFNTTEEYDGTSWSAGGNISAVRNALAAAGTQTVGLCFGGYGADIVVTTEEYDGTSWSAGGDLGTARYYLGGCGTQAAGLAFGGNVAGGSTATTEEYNAAPCYIKGYVKLSGVGLADVLVTLSGDSSDTYTTIADGYYEFLALPFGNYTVTPTLTHYTFAPVNYSYAPLSADQDNQDFVATLDPNYFIKGYCLDSDSVGITGVNVRLSGDTTNSYTTIAGGYYEFIGLWPGTYNVSPIKTNYTFAPTDRDYAPLGADQSDQNFVGSPPDPNQTLWNEINRPISTVFRRAYIKRRLVTTGLYEKNWQNITDYVMSWGNVNIGIDNIRLNNFTHSGIDLTMDNTSGKFNHEDKTNSLWYGYLTRYRSLLKIESGYITDGGDEYPVTTTIGIFIITDEIKIDAVTNKATIHAKSLVSVFDEVRAAEVAGLGTINQTADELLAKIRDHTDGSGNFVFRNFITSTSWSLQSTTTQYNLATTTSIGEKTCWQLMNAIAECESFVLLVNRAGTFEFRDRNERTATSQFAFKGQGYPEQNVIALQDYGEGLNKFYTYYNLKWTSEDTTTSYVSAGTITTVDPSSTVWKYGSRIYKMENPFFANTATAQAVVDGMLSEFQTLKEEVKIKTKFCPQLNILDKVTFSYHSYDMANATIWDVFNWDEANWADDKDNFDWSVIPFKIISCRHNLNNFSSEFALRRI